MKKLYQIEGSSGFISTRKMPDRDGKPRVLADHMFVPPEDRGRGVAQAITDLMFEDADAEGVTIVMQPPQVQFDAQTRNGDRHWYLRWRDRCGYVHVGNGVLERAPQEPAN